MSFWRRTSTWLALAITMALNTVAVMLRLRPTMALCVSIGVTGALTALVIAGKEE